jgi:hypothetical protein
MSVKFIKLADIIINVAQIACVEKDAAGNLTIHFTAPTPPSAPSVGNASGSPVLVADHLKIVLTGSQASHVWDKLNQTQW